MTTINTTMENTMKDLTLENAKVWTYKDKTDLTAMENLKAAHIEYSDIQNSCKEALVYTSIKMGEIYKNAKVTMYKGGNKITNQEIGEQFGVSEATVRNYTKIYDNQEIILATFKPEELKISGMLAIINGRARQQKDGSIDKENKTKKISEYKFQNKQLLEENESLKCKNNELEKQLEEAKALIAEMKGEVK